MKFLIGVDIGTYSFDAVAKTVTISGINPITLEQVLLITNVNTNAIIYQFNKVGYGGTISSNIITLDFDTTSMSNSDNLQIFIDYQAQLPLPAGASVSIKQDLLLAELQLKADLTETQPVEVVNFPSVQPINDNGGSITVDGTVNANTGLSQPLTDTQLRASPVPVTNTSLPLPAGAATEATLATRLSESDFDTKTGSLTETAPTTDIASSGLNGRLQRIAQRLSSLITSITDRSQKSQITDGTRDGTIKAGSVLPTGSETALVVVQRDAITVGRIEDITGFANVAGQKTMSNSFPVVLSSDQSVIPVTITPAFTSAAASIFRNIALTNTAVAIKSSTGRVLGGHVYNGGVAVAYLHFYNVAAASVTVGTTVPVYSIPLPSTTAGSVANDWTPTIPIPFDTAISVAASTTPNGGIAPVTALVINLLYI